MEQISRKPPLSTLPLLLWLVFFLVVPCCLVLLLSFFRRGVYGGVVYDFTFDNYLRAFDFLYLRVAFNSVVMALVTAVSCAVIGFPMAYVMAVASKKVRAWLLLLVVIPFWTNFVVRAHAVKSILSDSGPINQVWEFCMGLLGSAVTPLYLGDSLLSLWVGMVSTYLPFMVIPIYVVLEKFDFQLLEAARDLGAKPLDVLLRILLPLGASGIRTGFIFVFTPALGEFVIPDMLGGSKILMIGNVISDQFLKTRDWPFGSTIALILIVAVLFSGYLFRKSGVMNATA